MNQIIVTTILLISFSAQAKSFIDKSPVSNTCLKKVVDAVNKHHTLAEGSVYALRVLYTGDFAASIMVGHSDETDPSDYLVTVEKKDCKIKSIVYTNEAIGVEQYTESEQIENIFKK
jgi:hypothetical protein